MNKVFYILGILIVSVFYGACDDDSDLPPDIDLTDGVLIACEGIPQQQNAQLDWYSKREGPLQPKMFKQQNGEAIGNILYSTTDTDEYIYILSNNPGTIIKADRNTLVTIDKLTGLGSPRYLLPLDGDKGYVSDASSGVVLVIDLTDLTIISTIETGTWTEDMLMVGDKVYVCNAGGNGILVIDPVLDRVIDSIEVGDSPNHIVSDRIGKVWVHCQGNFNSGSSGGLYRVDPDNLAVDRSYPFSESAGLSNGIAINADRSVLYFLHNDVFKMPIDPIQLPSEPFINSGFRSLYGIGVDPLNEDIWVSDAIDFTSRSEIFRYNSDGELLEQFRSGYNCNAFLFR